MLSFPPGIQVFMAVEPVDMRKSFDGLSSAVETVFERNVLDGHLFLFLNRRRDRMKLLHFAAGGFWLYYRLLESGTFEELKPVGDSCRLQIDATQLAMLLSGISLVASTKRRKRMVSQAA